MSSFHLIANDSGNQISAVVVRKVGKGSVIIPLYLLQVSKLLQLLILHSQSQWTPDIGWVMRKEGNGSVLNPLHLI